MNSPTPMPIRAHPVPARACVCSARTSRERAHTYTCMRTVHVDARNTRASVCVRTCEYGAACVHGHEDLGSKRSRGLSGSDPSTPARIRHTRTPMLRGRARRCLGGVPGLYPAGLRLRSPLSPPPLPLPLLPPRFSH